MMHQKPLKARLCLVVIGVLAGGTIACQPNSPGTGSPSAVPDASNPSNNTGAIAPSQSPRTEPTQPSLATYRSDRLGVQFSYSADEFVVDNEPPVPASTADAATADIDVWTKKHDQQIRAGAYNGGTEYPANVHIFVRNNPQQLSLRDWVEQSNLFGIVSGNFNQTTVAAQDAIAFESSGLYENESVVFASPDGARVIVIEVAKVGNEVNDAPYQTVFEQIIRSFEFVGE
ncbi:hypothetical protein [Oculatella sp. LEGE 06141]|uniref:hypothetical protein n=1 Tax=Oculatella sp. LEGE 06141 TaxID=1828648 RepID=UPI001D13F76B|nr:hypothetical protein [Oculatella sp. LEGE 06141]